MGTGAKGNSNLRYTAQLSVKEAIANAKLFKKEMASMGIDVSKAFDSKPMTEYQKNLVSLKKDFIDKKKTWQDLLEVEKKAQISSAQSKAEIDKLKVSEQELTVALKAKKISQEEYNLEQKKNIDAQKLAVATQKEADRQINQSNKLLREQLTIARQQEAQLEKNRKKLQQESSEYYQLNKALNAVRGRTKDVLAAMFDLERQGKKNSDAYKALEQRSKGMVAQTNILDRGIKKIDTTLGLHQRHVGDYGRALEGLSPHFASINAQLAMFGTSLQELSEEGGVKALGTSIATVGKNILTFLVSPVGLAIAAFTALYALFTGNKDTVIEFDNKLLNVSKTTNMAGRELDQFGNDIINLSRALKTVSTDKLLEYATVAGQLGVKGRDNILAFSEALAKLETASNISGEEGGSEIARLLTLTDGGVQNVKAFGDEIVNLGNNFAATEKEILTNAEQISQNTGLYKIGRQDVLAYATATKAVGLEAEVVGSAFNRTLSTFEKAIRTGKNIDELAKQTGKSVEQLKAQFKDNAAGVFNDFLGGLNKVNTSGGSVNEVLEKLGIVAVRDQRVISTLATTGYGKLTEAMDTVRNASGALDQEFNTASGKLVNQTKKFSIAWDNLVLSVENGQGVIGKASVGVIGFFTDIVDAITPSTRSYQYNGEEIDRLKKRYDELGIEVKKAGGIAKLSKTDQDELREVTAQLGALLPGVTTKFDGFANSLEISRDKVERMTKAQRELQQVMNRSDIKNANKDFAESERRAAAQLKIVEDVNSRVGKKQGFRTISSKDVLEQKDFLLRIKNDQYEAAKAIRSFGGELTDAQKKVIEFYEIEKKVVPTGKPKPKIDEGNDPPTRTAEFIKGEIKKIQELQKPLDIASKGYAEYAAKIKALRNELKVANGGKDSESISADKELNSAKQRQKNLQDEITKNHKAVMRSQHTNDNEELQAITDKYDALRKKAADFYGNKNNKGLKIDLSNIAGDQKSETDEILAKQQIAIQKQSFDTQKILFNEYEQYKTEFGVKEADKRFSEELKGYKTFVDYVKSLIPSDSDQSVLANKMRDLIDKDVLPKAQNDDLKIQQNNYARAYQNALTANQALLQIEADYQRDVKALGDSATEEQKAMLNRRKEMAIKSMNEENADRKAGYADLLENIDAMTRGNAIKALEQAKHSYTEDYKNKLITARQLADRIAALNRDIDNLNGNNIFKGISNAIERYKKAKIAFDKAATGDTEDKNGKANAVLAARAEMFGKIAEGAQAAAAGLSGIGEIFADLGIGGEKLQVVLGQVSGILEGAGGIANGIKNADPVAIVSGSIKLLSSAIDLFNSKDRKLNRQIEVYKEHLDSLGKAYAKLERDVNNSVGESYYTDSAKQIENLKQQEAELIKARDAEASKKKSDKSKVQEYNNAISEIPNKIEDINRAVSQMLLQSNFKEFSQNLSDALVSAFETGENSIDAMNDTFDKFIKKAVANSIQLKIIQPIIDDMMKEAGEYAKGNNNSILGFDFNKWRDLLAGVTDKSTQLLEEAYNGLGLDKGNDPKSSSLQKGIKSITSDQASALEGISRGQYDQQKKLVLSSGQQIVQLTTIGKSIGDIFQIARDSFAMTVRIEKNTADTVAELKNAVTELKGINKNTTNTGGSYRGSGFG